MIRFVLLSLPVFAFVALGWAAVRMRITPSAAAEALGAFSFRFALPALILHLVSNEPFRQSFDLHFFAGYLASGCLMFMLMFAASRLLGRQRSPAAAQAITATVGNLGFLGPPIILAFVGEHGAGPLVTAIISEVMILMSLGAVIMAAAGKEHSRPGSLILRGTIYNPVVMAIGAAAALALSGVGLPGSLDSFLIFLGASAAPTALFAIGGSLASQPINLATIKTAAGTTLVKLVVYPLTVWWLFAHVLHLDPFWTAAGVVLASLPSASSNYVLAQRYAADADQVSAGVVLSTIVSVVTVPLVGWLIVHS